MYQFQTKKNQIGWYLDDKAGLSCKYKIIELKNSYILQIHNSVARICCDKIACWVAILIKKCYKFVKYAAIFSYEK